MTMRRRGRFGVGDVLPMMFVAGLALAAFTSHTGGALADDAQLELVSIDAGDDKTQSSVDQSEATHVASTAVEETEAPKVKMKSCPRASK